jgi:hypothetical protein
MPEGGKKNEIVADHNEANHALKSRANLVSLAVKDPSTLHLQDPDQFTKRWQVACLGAMPWTAIEAEVSAEERSEAWEKCQGLAGHPR